MISKDYLHTRVYQSPDALNMHDGSLYIYGRSNEDRANAIIDNYKMRANNIVFIQLTIDDDDFDTIYDIDGKSYNLRNKEDIAKLISSELLISNVIYLDITVLPERIIAAIMHYAHLNNIDIVTIYVEPCQYKIREFQKAGVYHDLSTEINGIAPLPGFVSINSDDNNEIPSKMVVFIGFEGGRFTHIYEQFDISGDNILPIVGTPGYRIEYPFVSLWGNRQTINSSGAWRNIKYCVANSIVDAYYTLKEIENTNPNTMLKIVPIGTKPHTIATLAFALNHAENVEIVYDNPKKIQQRSDGIGAIIETNLKSLIAGI